MQIFAPDGYEVVFRHPSARGFPQSRQAQRCDRRPIAADSDIVVSRLVDVQRKRLVDVREYLFHADDYDPRNDVQRRVAARFVSPLSASTPKPATHESNNLYRKGPRRFDDGCLWVHGLNMISRADRSTWQACAEKSFGEGIGDQLVKPHSDAHASDRKGWL
jgi:hypothetical protein